MTDFVPNPGTGALQDDKVSWMSSCKTIVALVALFATPLAADAQRAAKIARIGYLTTNLAAGPALEGFRQGLRNLGYVEGRTVWIEYRAAEGKPERLPAFAAELVALKVDVIVAPTVPAALAAKQATATLPIVFIGAADPIADGLVAITISSGQPVL